MESSGEINYDESEDFAPMSDEEEDDYKPSYCKLPYSNSILFAHRYNLSENECAAMINAVLLDIGECDKSKFISPSQVRNLKKSHGHEVLTEHEEKKGFLYLKFDGKSHEALLPNNHVKRVHSITVANDDGYIDHFQTEGETGAHIADGVMKVVVDTESQDTLLAVGTGGFLLRKNVESKQI